MKQSIFVYSELYDGDSMLNGLQSCDLKELVATIFVLFLAVGSRDLMYPVTTSFFVVSSFSCRDPVSLSRLKLMCNTPKYTLLVFDMFRVFCKHNLNVS